MGFSGRPFDFEDFPDPELGRPRFNPKLGRPRFTVGVNEGFAASDMLRLAGFLSALPPRRLPVFPVALFGFPGSGALRLAA